MPKQETRPPRKKASIRLPLTSSASKPKSLYDKTAPTDGAALQYLVILVAFYSAVW